jgi:hypothetical protein
MKSKNDSGAKTDGKEISDDTELLGVGSENEMLYTYLTRLLKADFDDEWIQKYIRELKQEAMERRKRISSVIDHQSYDDLAELMQIIKRKTDRFDIMTRHILKEMLDNRSDDWVETAIMVLENAGPQQAMLFLLGDVFYFRFGDQLIDPSNKIRTPLKKQ